MKEKRVLVSCIPQLNSQQHLGMLRLLQDFEQAGYKVFFWSHNSYASFSSFEVNVNELRRDFRFRFLYWRALLFIDKRKWQDRLARWLNLSDRKQIRRRYNSLLKEAVNVLDSLNPALFICWNPYCCEFGIAFDVAHTMRIKTSAIEWGFLPETFILDRNGTLASSEIFNRDPIEEEYEGDLQVLLSEGERVFQSLNLSSLSLYKQQKVIFPDGLEEEKDGLINILLLGIDEVDSGAFPVWHRERYGLLPFFESSMDAAKAIAALSSTFRVIFKPHPSHNDYSVNQRVSSNLWIVNGNPDALIDWAKVVVCSGSKMEFSALLRGKPLVNIGAGLLYGKGIAYEVTKQEDMERVIINSLTDPEQSSHLFSFKKFLGFLMLEYLYVPGERTEAVISLTKIV